MAELEMVTFTIIVDDIVYPDGRTAMALLGGGGPQTAFGAQVWTPQDKRIGLAAGIGSDFPGACREWLENMGIDTSGLLEWESPTLRAWQILEEDGRRTQVWRVNMGDDVWDMLKTPIERLPPPYQTAKTYHIGVHPSGRDVDFIHSLRSTGAQVVSVEVYTHALEIVTRSELKALVSAGHIFSPNEKEAASLVGPGSSMELIGRLAELGAEVVVLRRGHLGCIAHRADSGETWEVPAFHSVLKQKQEVEYNEQHDHVASNSRVVDPTGCGNTFCGGFLIGWWKTRDLLKAAVWGSVSASFSDRASRNATSSDGSVEEPGTIQSSISYSTG
ncbi:uncharacterized protein C16C9.01c [Selaginella moellendorffii]|uniref:uncharacterized protein C16C9.01c n=1 Tax=Selaginella moellendorffii TaxID=88036 RepID=UPI000D1CCB3C|nr:uncharacterized protein C16C9.01c [Selaginella moellendorffii]|eukprot:XP_024545143.1 uncharacterized protein C16C9.01c [Selaginella moellendorffii]